MNLFSQRPYWETDEFVPKTSGKYVEVWKNKEKGYYLRAGECGEKGYIPKGTVIARYPVDVFEAPIENDRDHVFAYRTTPHLDRNFEIQDRYSHICTMTIGRKSVWGTAHVVDASPERKDGYVGHLMNDEVKYVADGEGREWCRETYIRLTTPEIRKDGAEKYLGNAAIGHSVLTSKSICATSSDAASTEDESKPVSQMYLQVRAVDDIWPGEEITCQYGPNYWFPLPEEETATGGWRDFAE